MIPLLDLIYNVVHYPILNHLPRTTLQLLLNIFNYYWLSDLFPSTWHQSIVIPIAKRGKDTENPNNYRPIALTSCLSRTLECIINNGLMWYLEKNKLLSPIQNGFRKNRSTTDHLVRFETYLREAFVKYLSCYIFWYRKSLWYYMETWNSITP